jgi:hypothetical protein
MWYRTVYRKSVQAAVSSWWVNQQTLYFSDRPVRIAGHLKMAAYLKEWTSKAGKDNFGADPPNAAKIIEGKLPAAGGPTSPFIDQTERELTMKSESKSTDSAAGLIVGWSQRPGPESASASLNIAVQIAMPARPMPPSCDSMPG